MKDIMIDIETMGTWHDAPVVAIGAVGFCRETRILSENTFYESIDFDSAFEHGTPSGATVAWWLSQSTFAKSSLENGIELGDALCGLSNYISSFGKGVKVWGNGATFDITILETAYKSTKYDAPWMFWDIRDVRTVVDLAQGFCDRPKITNGTAHNALHDAEHQAIYVMDMIAALRGEI